MQRRSAIARILVAASVIALAAGGAASAGTRGTGHPSGRPLGILPPQVPGAPLSPSPASVQGTAGPTNSDNLTYSGPDQSGHGPVMRTNTVYTIFWVPSGYSVPANYKTVVNQFFRDVAADSSKATNVYASDTQYSDANGAIQYDSTFGGSTTDYRTYPNTCSTPTFYVSDTTVCVSDSVLRNEVKRIAADRGWPNGPNVLFVIYTAHDVETCYDSTTCAYTDYCAYHDSFTRTTGEYIYAHVPYPNQTFRVGSGTTQAPCTGPNQAYPNAGGAGGGTDAAAADEAINASSHEHNEAITDPTGDGWWVDNFNSLYVNYENGDLCAWYFPNGAVLGGSGNTRYNQAINGHHYFLQGEWSNADATGTANSGCIWSYGILPVNTAIPTITGTTTVGAQLTGHAGTWTNAPTSYAYAWRRCDSNGSACSTISASGSSSATTTYTLQAADSGHTIRLAVTARNASGRSLSAATSAHTAVVSASAPVNSAPPTVTGTFASGSTITGHAGTWSNSPTSYNYHWLRCASNGASCTTIASASSSSSSATATYGLTATDAGHTIRVRVAAVNGSGAGAWVNSAKSPLVSS